MVLMVVHQRRSVMVAVLVLVLFCNGKTTTAAATETTIKLNTLTTTTTTTTANDISNGSDGIRNAEEVSLRPQPLLQKPSAFVTAAEAHIAATARETNEAAVRRQQQQQQQLLLKQQQQVKSRDLEKGKPDSLPTTITATTTTTTTLMARMMKSVENALPTTTTTTTRTVTTTAAAAALAAKSTTASSAGSSTPSTPAATTVLTLVAKRSFAKSSGESAEDDWMSRADASSHADKDTELEVVVEPSSITPTTYRPTRPSIAPHTSAQERERRLMNVLAARRNALHRGGFRVRVGTTGRTATSLETTSKSPTDPRSVCIRNCTKNFTRRTTASCMRQCANFLRTPQPHNASGSPSPVAVVVRASSKTGSSKEPVNDRDTNEILFTDESSHGLLVVAKEQNDTLNHIPDTAKSVGHGKLKSRGKTASALAVTLASTSIEDDDIQPYLFFGQKLPPIRPQMLTITSVSDEHPRLLEVAVAEQTSPKPTPAPSPLAGTSTLSAVERSRSRYKYNMRERASVASFTRRNSGIARTPTTVAYQSTNSTTTSTVKPTETKEPTILAASAGEIKSHPNAAAFKLATSTISTMTSSTTTSTMSLPSHTMVEKALPLQDADEPSQHRSSTPLIITVLGEEDVATPSPLVEIIDTTLQNTEVSERPAVQTSTMFTRPPRIFTSTSSSKDITSSTPDAEIRVNSSASPVPVIASRGSFVAAFNPSTTVRPTVIGGGANVPIKRRPGFINRNSKINPPSIPLKQFIEPMLYPTLGSRFAPDDKTNLIIFLNYTGSSTETPRSTFRANPRTSTTRTTTTTTTPTPAPTPAPAPTPTSTPTQTTTLVTPTETLPTTSSAPSISSATTDASSTILRTTILTSVRSTVNPQPALPTINITNDRPAGAPTAVPTSTATAMTASTAAPFYYPSTFVGVVQTALAEDNSLLSAAVGGGEISSTVVTDEHEVSEEVHRMNVATMVLAGIGVVPLVVVILYLVRHFVSRRTSKEDDDFDVCIGDQQPISPVKKLDSKYHGSGSGGDDELEDEVDLHHHYSNHNHNHNHHHVATHHKQTQMKISIHDDGDEGNENGTRHNYEEEYSVTSDQEFDRNNIRLKSLLGEGNFGQVWKAEADDLCGHFGATRIVAVKTIRACSAQSGLKDEANIMRKLGSHPNVVTLLGACVESEPHMLIMEYAMRGRLLSLLRAARNATNILPASVPGGRSLAPLSPRTLAGFSLDIACGMEYIAQKRIVHRDLAARNVLLDHNGVCKICDFGMSLDLDAERLKKEQEKNYMNQLMHGETSKFKFDFGGRFIRSHWSSNFGSSQGSGGGCTQSQGKELAAEKKTHGHGHGHGQTHSHDTISRRPALPIRWMAPEALHYHDFTTETDVWAFGIVLWEIATLGSTPYAHLTGREVIRRVPNGLRPELPKEGRHEFYNLMARCWHKDPQLRPTFTQARMEISRNVHKWLDTDDGEASDYMDVSGFSEDLEHGMVYFNHRISEFECEI